MTIFSVNLDQLQEASTAYYQLADEVSDIDTGKLPLNPDWASDAMASGYSYMRTQLIDMLDQHKTTLESTGKTLKEFSDSARAVDEKIADALNKVLRLLSVEKDQ